MASNNVIDNLQKAIAGIEQAITVNKNELTILKANILEENINTKRIITNNLKTSNLKTAEFQKLQKEVNNTPLYVRHAVSAGFGALITEKGKIPYLSGKKILFI